MSVGGGAGLRDSGGGRRCRDGRGRSAGQPAGQGPLGGPPQRTGRFEYRYDTDTDTWTWSDTVFSMHGYRPGEVIPTTALVLGHKHPDDLARVRALLAQSAAPFSSRHRIITTAGQMRMVVVAGDAVTDSDGHIVATRGFYVDITDGFTTDLHEAITAKVDMILDHRQVIDQAKGMLMAIYRIDADAAFGVLRGHSQQLNVKVITIAEKLLADLPNVLDTSPTTATPVDHYLAGLSFGD